MSQHSALTYILCGGAGINLGKDIHETARTTVNKKAQFIGLDTSDRNNSDGLFEITRMPSNMIPGMLAQGAGKDITAYSKSMAPFVAETLGKVTLGRHVVVVGSGAGGTGSGMTLAVVRYVLSKGISCVLALVSDHSSLIEMHNSVKVKTSFANQVQPRILNKVIPFIDIVNDHRTRGEVNDEAVKDLDYLSLFLTDNNEEMDIEDIGHTLQYSSVPHLNIPPALSRITFIPDDYLDEARKNKHPVSYATLFKNRNDVVGYFDKAAYRSTGVFNLDNNPPPDVNSITMALDHGEALERLKLDIKHLDEAKEEAIKTYSKQEDIAPDANSDGSTF